MQNMESPHILNVDKPLQETSVLRHEFWNYIFQITRNGNLC
jgi:hypothetical protein